MVPVSIDSVSVSFQSQVALQNVTVQFHLNRITGVLGRSGSGKSTLLQLVNGLIRPQKGSVTVHQQPIDYNRLSHLRIKIGYVVQGLGLFPHLTVRQNISMLAKVVAVDNSDQRVREWMDLTELPSHYAERYPHELSGGEQQRVAICRALFLDPPLLLMDEPFSALDPITRAQMQEELLKLQRHKPRTVLFVTHDLREAARLADDILVMDKGVIQQLGTKEQVLKNPATELVLQFIQTATL